MEIFFESFSTRLENRIANTVIIIETTHVTINSNTIISLNLTPTFVKNTVRIVLYVGVVYGTYRTMLMLMF